MSKEFEPGIFTKDDLSYNQKEYRLQCHIVKQHEHYFPHVLMTHIPNKGGDATDGFFKKQMGVRKGVSDIAIWWLPDWLNGDRKLHYGLKPMQAGMIEIKVDSKISGAQNKWLSAFDACGGYQGIAHSWKEYYKLLCKFGIKPKEECVYFQEPDYTTTADKFQAAYDWQKP